MALTITRKTRTILLIVLAVLVVGGGAFLIWRITREDTVAPEDSEASCPDGCYYHAPTDSCTGTYGCVWRDGTGDQRCGGSCGGGTGACAGEERSASGIAMCCDPCDTGGGCTGCGCTVTCSGNYPLESCPSGHSCSQTTQTCTKVDSCGDACGGENSKVCYKDNGPIVVNTCEGGYWVDRPKGSYPYGTGLNPIVIKTTDPDGLGAVTVKVNGNSKPICQNLTGATCYQKVNKDIKIYISPGQQYIGPGDYGITVTWKDGKGKGGDDCTKSTTFTINEEVVDPECSARAQTFPYTATEWAPTGIGFCKVGSSAVPNYSELTENFPDPGETVEWECKNSSGSVDCQASRADIDDPSCGTLANNYSSSTTTWPSGTFCAVGSPNPLSPTFPGPGDTTEWGCVNEDKEVDCIATRDSTPDDPDIPENGSVPQTGLLDTVIGRVSLGISFIFIGGLVSQYSRLNYLVNSVTEKHRFQKEIRQKKKEARRTARRREKLEDRFK
jgi:hypothetical protein